MGFDMMGYVAGYVETFLMDASLARAVFLVGCVVVLIVMVIDYAKGCKRVML